MVPGGGKAGSCWRLEAPSRESKINLLSLNKLILVVPGGGKAGGWGGPGQGIQNQFVEAQQIDFGGSGPWEGWRLGRHPGRESKMNFVEAQQIDFGCSGPWEAAGWEVPGRESKINLLRLNNKLILVVPGGGKAGGWGGTRAGNPKSIC